MDAAVDELVALVPSLRGLCDSLQCQICYSWFTGPVLLRCGHSFCSTCIRTDLSFKQKAGHALACPVCRKEADPDNLIPNLVLRQAVAAIKSFLPSMQLKLETLKAQQAQQPIPPAPALVPRPQPSRQVPSPSSRPRKRSKPLAQLDRDVVMLDQSDNDSMHGIQSVPAADIRTQQQAPTTPSSSIPNSESDDPDFQPGEEQGTRPARSGSRPAQARPELQGRTEGGAVRAAGNEATQQPAASSRGGVPPPAQGLGAPGVELPAPEGCVACPCCGMSINTSLINTHLDVCLARAAGRGPAATQPTRRPASHDRQPVRSRTEAGKATSTQLPAARTAPSGAHDRSQQPALTGPTGQALPVVRHPAAATAADVPGKLVFNVLKDKDIKAKLKQFGLPAEGSREEMIQRYSAYRLYLQSKLDAGSNMPVPQLRDSFLAQQRQQQAARRASPSLAAGQLGGVGSLLVRAAASQPVKAGRQGGGTAAAQGPGSNRSSPEVFELRGDRVIGVRPSAGQPGVPRGSQVVNKGAPGTSGFAFNDLIAEVKKRREAALGSPSSSGQGRVPAAVGSPGAAARQQHAPLATVGLAPVLDHISDAAAPAGPSSGTHETDEVELSCRHGSLLVEQADRPGTMGTANIQTGQGRGGVHAAHEPDSCQLPPSPAPSPLGVRQELHDALLLPGREPGLEQGGMPVGAAPSLSDVGVADEEQLLPDVQVVPDSPPYLEHQDAQPSGPQPSLAEMAHRQQEGAVEGMGDVEVEEWQEEEEGQGEQEEQGDEEGQGYDQAWLLGPDQDVDM